MIEFCYNAQLTPSVKLGFTSYKFSKRALNKIANDAIGMVVESQYGDRGEVTRTWIEDDKVMGEITMRTDVKQFWKGIVIK